MSPEEYREQRAWRMANVALGSAIFPSTRRVLLKAFRSVVTTTATVGSRALCLQLSDNVGNVINRIPIATIAASTSGQFMLGIGQNATTIGTVIGSALPAQMVMEVDWELRLLDLSAIDNADAVTAITALIERLE